MDLLAKWICGDSKIGGFDRSISPCCTIESTQKVTLINSFIHEYPSDALCDDVLFLIAGPESDQFNTVSSVLLLSFLDDYKNEKKMKDYRLGRKCTSRILRQAHQP